MPTLSNPTEIARETFKQLAAQRVAPTPENYARIYYGLAETPPPSAGETEQQIVAVLQNLGRAHPQSGEALKTLSQALAQQDWKAFTQQFDALLTHKRAAQSGWADLVRDLLRQWDLKQTGLTSARKKESLDRVLINFGKDPDALFDKLRGLVNAWSEGAASAPDIGLEPESAAAISAPEDRAENRVGAPLGPLVDAEEIPGMLSDLLAKALLHGVLPRIAHFPELADRASALAAQARDAEDLPRLNQFAQDIRQFWIELELRADADRVVLDGLMRLLRLLIDNITELLLDDQWLRGQLNIVQDIISKPLSPTVIGEAEKRIKEVVFKQGTLKHSLNEAKTSLKNLVTLFISRLGEMSASTGDFHVKIENHVTKLGQTEDLPSINAILQELISDTKTLHLDMVRSHEELLNARRQAEAAEQKMHELETELDQISELVYQDHLTGTLNRRGMDEAFVREFARAQRGQTPISVALLDIDHFKRINDTFGHDVGDQALVHLASVVKEILRPMDVVARYGGEEFVIILPDTSQADGVNIMTRLQRDLTKRFFLHENEKLLITFSAGVAQRTAEESSESLIARADTALYRAKQAGRNRVFEAEAARTAFD